MSEKPCWRASARLQITLKRRRNDLNMPIRGSIAGAVVAGAAILEEKRPPSRVKGVQLLSLTRHP